jgi:uncharacterized RDD family membrane protein YckC
MAKLIINPTSTSRREISLSRTILSIGRDPSNDVVLPDAMVSRRHAVVEWRGSQYYIRDCNSSNGSLVNGDRVSERTLRDGDLVAIGTARMLFREEVDEPSAKVVQHPSAPRLSCPSCQADYRKGDQFCRQCGGALAPSQPPKAVCTSCGTAVPLPARFCNACGHTLGPSPPAGPSGSDDQSTRERPNADADGSPSAFAKPAEEGTPGEAAARGEELARPSPVASIAPVAVEGGGAAAAAATELPPPAPEGLRPVPTPPARPAGMTEVPRPASGPARPAASPAPVHRSSPASRLKTPAAPAPAADAPATFGPRLAAGLVDFAIVGLGQLAVMSPVIYYWESHRMPATPAEVSFWPILLSLLLVPVVVALGCVYYVYHWGVKGATPGKRLLGLVVQADDGKGPIGISRATIRVLGYLLSGLALGFGFWMIAFGGTALHDKMAGTRVVRRRRT